MFSIPSTVTFANEELHCFVRTQLFHGLRGILKEMKIKPAMKNITMAMRIHN